jgi:hypothetical protein
MNGGAALGEDFGRAFQEDETDCQFYYCEVLRRSGCAPLADGLNEPLT